MFDSNSVLILNSQRIVLDRLFVIIFTVLPIHFFHVILSNLVDFVLNTHFGGFLELLLRLHLVETSQFHLRNFILTLLLVQPGFVTFGVVRVVVHSFVLDGFLTSLIISKLSYLICFIQFFVFQPVLHVTNSRVMTFLFLFCIFEQFLSNFSFLFCNELLFESFFSVFGSNPLLEVRSVAISVSASRRSSFSSSRIKERNVRRSGTDVTFF